MSAASIAKYVYDTETWLRLAKVVGWYAKLGYGRSNAVSLQTLEIWMKGVTATQNVLRLFKAPEVYVRMRDDKRPNDKIHQVFTYFGPASIATVAAAGLLQFLNDQHILALPTMKANLHLFGKYGGGIAGNAIAAISAFKMAREDWGKGDKRAEIEKNFLSGAKYGLDLVSSFQELCFGMDSVVARCAKGLSCHVALVQSASSCFKVPLKQLLPL